MRILFIHEPIQRPTSWYMYTYHICPMVKGYYFFQCREIWVFWLQLIRDPSFKYCRPSTARFSSPSPETELTEIYIKIVSPLGGKKPCYMISAVILFTKLSCLAEMMVKTTNFFGSMLKKFTNLSFKHFCVTCMPPLYQHVSSLHSAHSCNAHLPRKNNSQFPFLIPDL